MAALAEGIVLPTALRAFGVRQHDVAFISATRRDVPRRRRTCTALGFAFWLSEFQCLATYLYQDNARCWYAMQPTVTKLGDDLGYLADDTFAFAEAFDEPNERYLGLRGGQVLAFSGDAVGFLVKSAIAELQLEAERPKPSAKTDGVGVITPGAIQTSGGPTQVTSTAGSGPRLVAAPPTHFFGSVKVDAARISREVGTFANEIIQHLASLPNSEILVTVEIQARVSGGVSDNVVRTVSENCRTLKFKSQSFEQK